MSVIAAVLSAAVERGDPPAASACVIANGAVVHESAHGAATDSVFDLASITKVLGTTLAIADRIADGSLTLETDVARILPLGAPITVRELLGHRSGMRAWRPFFMEVLVDPVLGALYARRAPALFGMARARVLERVFATPIDPNKPRVYSDLGFITLGALLERIGSPLGESGASDLGYVNLAAPTRWLDGRHVLPTGRTRPREGAPGQERQVQVPSQEPRDEAGCVDDDNAFVMGGIAGHAGMFGTARAVALAGARILERLDADPILREFARSDPGHGPDRGLGFDRPSGPSTSVGAWFGRGGSRGAIGHLGFTGCSLWLDIDRRICAVLLTNRTYPGRHRVDGIRALRPAFHDAIGEELA